MHLGVYVCIGRFPAVGFFSFFRWAFSSIGHFPPAVVSLCTLGIVNCVGRWFFCMGFLMIPWAFFFFSQGHFSAVGFP